MKAGEKSLKIVNLDHLGIIAGIIDEMELVEEVNKKVGVSNKEKVSPGQVMKAMILNGLGFLSAPLYLFEQFFVGKATEHLIGEGILPEHLNDDRLGRALDQYYEAGTTQLFMKIALKAVEKFEVKMKSVHLDGTSMYVQGEYKKKEGEKGEEESEMKGIELRHGYSRDHRPDLKQFIIDMICTEDGDIPLYLKIDSGNVDNKSVFVERIKEFKKQWKFEGIYVADSALYTENNLQAMSKIKWISRVPLSVKEAQEKIVEIKEEEWEESEIGGYKIGERESEYGGIKQRWLIVESEKRKESSQKQIDKKVEKEKKEAETLLRKVSREKFACEEDAIMALEKVSSSWKYYQVKEIKCKKRSQNKKSVKSEKSSYEVTGKLERKEKKIELEKKRAGRFILATNVVNKEELNKDEMLKEYKGQQANERGFRFIKDPLFFTSSVFVKNRERVEAIAMIMGLCLLVYNLAQRKLREKLKLAEEGIKNQVKKVTSKPTMRWVFQVFQAIHLVMINEEKHVSNLTEEHEKIISFLGQGCGKYYLKM